MLNLPPPVVLVACVTAAGLMTALFAARKHPLAVVIPLPGMALGFLAMSVNSFLIGLAMLIVVVISAVAQLRWQSFALVMLVLLVAISTLHHFDAAAQLDELAALRREYPVQSLKGRLEFHARNPVAGGVEAAAAYRPGPAPSPRGSRIGQLKLLHADHYDQFVAAAGFGPVRMPRVRREQVELPRTRPPVVTKDICFDNHERPDRPTPDLNDLNTLYQSGLRQFVDDERMGYVESVERVIGFEPHAIQSPPAAINVEADRWQVSRLELVSLLKHDTPVAYLSDNLPNLDELGTLKTRPLDEFEQSSLSKLQAGDELVTAEEPTILRMLGAVRAGESCVACHSVPQKTLLGAFSYELRPVQDDETGATDRK